MKQLRSAVFLLGCALSAFGQTPPSFTITNFAGNGTSGFSGDGSAATSAQLFLPFSVAVSGSKVYIVDQANQRIRLVNGGTISTVAGSGTAGNSGDAAAALKANLNQPAGVVADSTGLFYVSDTVSAEVRKVTTDGNINQFAGVANTQGFSGDAAAANLATLNHPSALLLDSAGNLLILDSFNGRIRKVTTDLNIATLAGNGNVGFAGDGAAATSATFNYPEAMAIDAAGNVFVADSSNHRIRKITTDGNVTTVVGSGLSGYSGDGGPATAARLNHPRGVAVDSAGNIYIADTYNHVIRMVTGGKIYTIAGTGVKGYAGDGGPSAVAQLSFPSGVAVSGSTIYVTDSQNHVVRLLTPTTGAPSISSGGVATAGAYGASTAVAPGSWIEIFGSSLSATTRSWTSTDFLGNTAPTSLDGVSVVIGGQNAFVSYISPNQVNAQIPSTVGAGPQQVFVANSTGATAPVGLTVNSTQPGLLAPASFRIGSQQYVAAVLADGTYVAPTGKIPGITSRPAKPGETIVLYGVGFGPVAPVSHAGQITQLLNGLQQPVRIQFGGTPAPEPYAYQGLVPGQVGLYQFNVVVPNIAANSAVPLTMTQGGAPVGQTLFTAVQP
jgi:uncharacterized protein (TIGR03437 family)